MLKNNFKWDETDIKAIVEYCISTGVSASMTLRSRELFNEFVKSIFQSYPSEATVRKHQE